MNRCPCCSARLREPAKCARCQADLSAVIESELSAQRWLSKAMQYRLESKTEQSAGALQISLRLKKTRLAVVFREFLIQQQCKDILDLLSKKQLLPAKQQLYNLRLFVPYSKQLQDMNSFTDYLLIKNHENAKTE